MNIKKIFFATGISFALLLGASQAFAALYAPGQAVNNGVTPTTIQQGMPQPASGNRVYFSPMPNGAQYQMMSGQPGAGMVSYGYSRQAVLWQLLLIITVVLIWTNLLLLIAFLWKKVTKHEHK